jgi:hypothetical protein
MEAVPALVRALALENRIASLGFEDLVLDHEHLAVLESLSLQKLILKNCSFRARQDTCVRLRELQSLSVCGGTLWNMLHMSHTIQWEAPISRLRIVCPIRDAVDGWCSVFHLSNLQVLTFVSEVVDDDSDDNSDYKDDNSGDTDDDPKDKLDAPAADVAVAKSRRSRKLNSDLQRFLCDELMHLAPRLRKIALWVPLLGNQDLGCCLKKFGKHVEMLLVDSAEKTRCV